MTEVNWNKRAMTFEPAALHWNDLAFYMRLREEKLVRLLAMRRRQNKIVIHVNIFRSHKW